MINKINYFILQCIVVTICAIILSYFFIPKYEFFDVNNRYNKITGIVEHHNGYHWK